MNTCKHCGNPMEDAAKFCSFCGTACETEASAVHAEPIPAYDSEFDAQDIASNKGLAVLAYLGILFLIPWFAAPNSKFARFHAKQGLLLCIADMVYLILSFLLNLIKIPQTTYLWGFPVEIETTPWYITLIVFLIGIPLIILTVIGIINAVKGNAKKLPVLGKIELKK